MSAYTKEQIEQAIARAQQDGNTAAVKDLQSRLSDVQPDDGTAWMANYNPADEVGALEAALIGAGRTADKFVTGVTDLFADDESQAATAKDQAQKDTAFARLRAKHPVSTTAGEIAGYIPSAFVPGGLWAQMASGGALAAAMYNKPEDRVRQGLTDAAINAVPYGIGRVFKRAGGTRLAQRAKDLDWGLTPAEKTGSPALRTLEGSMEAFPPTAGPIRKMKAGRQESMNRIALDAIGETGDDFADDALIAARTRVGAVFDDVIKSKTFPVDDTFIDSLAAIENKAKQGILGGGDTDKIINNILDASANGSVTGQQLQTWRTTLQTAANKAARSDSATQEYADALSAMVDAVDDMVTRNISGDELAKWGKAREQWRVIKQLEKAKAIDEVGNVRGAKLANNLSSSDTQGYFRQANKSDLYDAARLSKAYPPMPDSGTAGRLSIPMMAGIAATSPVSIPLMAASNIAARGYARPEQTGKLMAAIIRGYPFEEEK